MLAPGMQPATAMMSCNSTQVVSADAGIGKVFSNVTFISSFHSQTETRIAQTRDGRHGQTRERRGTGFAEPLALPP
jgi:hypothetical protein